MVVGVVVVVELVDGSPLVVVVVDPVLVVAGLVAAPRYATPRPEVTAEPTSIAWVSRFTRVNRRSRCCGVRGGGVMSWLGTSFMAPGKDETSGC